MPKNEAIANVAGDSHGGTFDGGKEQTGNALSCVNQKRCDHRRQDAVNLPESFAIASNYDDIIDLPRPVSRKRPPMPLRDRAAQFAPFAALEGYEELLAETARKVEERFAEADRPDETDGTDGTPRQKHRNVKP